MKRDSSEKDGIHIKQDNSKKNSSAKPKRKGMIAGIIAGAVVVLLAIGLAAAGLYINKLDTVYPNVTVGGVKLSGMTLTEAKKALTDSGYDQNASNIAATVKFPDGEKMTITGEKAGLKLQVDQAAQAAYAFGRGGSFITNELNYIKCIFKTNALDEDGTAAIDESSVKSAVSESAKRFNEKLMSSSYKVTDKSIEFVKGAGGALADEDALFDLVIDALNKSIAQKSPVSVDYTLGTGSGSDVDLTSLYNSIHKDPVDAVYDKATNSVTQSQAGVGFDIDTAQKALDAAKTGTSVTIPLVYTDPAVTTEALQGMLFRDVLSEKSTYVAGTSNRIHNVKLAAAACNQTVLNPGDTFSYNDTLGERTTAKGYLEAGAYVGGAVVQEVGGGICQMSSTLYYCVLYSNLEVVYRRNHMFIVTYLPLGDDATVNWGTVDFKFKNNTMYPIRIEATYKDGYLNVRLLGTKTDTNRTEVNYVVISTTDFKTVQKEDPSIAPGTTKEESSGHKGYVVESYKYIYDINDNLISKTFIDRSTYKVQDKVILVPVGTLTSPTPSPSESPSASPSESPPSESPPIESPPIESPPIESPPIESPSPSPSEEPASPVV